MKLQIQAGVGPVFQRGRPPLAASHGHTGGRAAEADPPLGDRPRRESGPEPAPPKGTGPGWKEGFTPCRGAVPSAHRHELVRTDSGSDIDGRVAPARTGGARACSAFRAGEPLEVTSVGGPGESSAAGNEGLPTAAFTVATGCAAAFAASSEGPPTEVSTVSRGVTEVSAASSEEPPTEAATVTRFPAPEACAATKDEPPTETFTLSSEAEAGEGGAGEGALDPGSEAGGAGAAGATGAAEAAGVVFWPASGATEPIAP